MSFELTDEQTLVRDTARGFAERELAPKAAARDRSSQFPIAELKALADLGLLGVNIPEPLGGAAAGVVAYSLAMQEIARADASVAVAMAVTNMVGEVIVRFGTESQQKALVPLLTSGAAIAGAFGLSEPQAGSDPGAMTTTAKRTANGWRLDGNKQWITSGDKAGVFVIWAKTDATQGTKGISAFAVKGGTPGLSAGKKEDKMGLRGSSTVPLLLEGCEVGEDALLGKLGGGLSVALAALDGGRIGIASQALGIGQAAVIAAKNYVRERKQFGRALAEFQAIQFRLADAATELEAARLLTLRAAWLKQEGRPFSREASMAKLYASESAGRACDAAIQLHGGYGYTRDFPVERYARDVRVTRIYEGTSEVQRIVIARSLLAHLSTTTASATASHS
ncbi:MAG TPA: acyl-CoA dehydrogenase family protein [Polyangia bacterium]|nr:acyl-CoA dehydrogenase family protein [Polyangia bacterium]